MFHFLAVGCDKRISIYNKLKFTKFQMNLFYIEQWILIFIIEADQEKNKYQMKMANFKCAGTKISMKKRAR
ncbi:MAG: hypothetical protein IPH66_02415 [Crocinitomicaceae bacterium]|nr:hypothetical protein [Crocinitomicaceae bacterium]